MLYARSVIFTHCGQAQDAASFRYPVIIKLVRPLSSFKVLISRDVAEVENLLQAHAQDYPILGSEYIEGDDQQLFFGALMLDCGTVLQGIVGRIIASFPPARRQTTVAETVDNPEVMHLTRQFFEGLGLWELVSLELKRDTAGRYWVIEPTVGRTDF